jgi:hypothetical protein
MICSIAYGQSSGTWTIERTEDGCILTGYNGSDTDIIIPAKWGGLSVIGIGDEVLRSKKITSVTIPEGVMTIGDYAFEYNQISRVTLPSTIVSIGERAFYGNDELTQITLPTNLHTIGDGAFASNQLTSITIPASVKNIEGNPFWNNDELLQIIVADGNPAFMSVDGMLLSKDQKKLIAYPAGKGEITNIPSGVTTIGVRAFYGVQTKSLIIPSSISTIENDALYIMELRSITLPKDIDMYETNNANDPAIFYNRSGKKAGIYVYDKNASSITESWSFYANTDEMLEVEFTENGIAITDYKGYGGSLELPSEIDGFPIVSINANVFAGRGLTHIIIPLSVTSVGDSAFDGNPLLEATQQAIQERYGEAVLIPQYRVGDIGPSGNFIFYDKGNNYDGWRYLEVAPENSESKGNLNHAESYCQRLNISGLTGWRLPSIDELNWMYRNLKQRDLGDFKDERYWSSTETNVSRYRGAQVMDFITGRTNLEGRQNNSFNIRAIRQF